MKAKGCFLVSALLLLTAFSGNAFAGGWGPYFSWGRDQPSAGFPDGFIDRAVEFAHGIPGLSDQEIRDALEGVDLDFQIDHITFGVLYDSAPSLDKLFNYRLAMGFDIATKTEVSGISIPEIGISLSGFAGELDQNGYGFSMNHTFGFSLLRTELFKWWIGPGIRLNFDYYSLDNGIKAANLVIGGGGETGINVHISPTMSLCLGGGIHYNAFGYGAGTNDVGSLVWGDGPFYFIQVAALFHTGEDKDAWASGASAP